MVAKRILTIFLTLLVAVPLAACGGDDNDDGARDDFIRDAKTVERKFESDFANAQQALNSAKTPAESLEALESTLRAIGSAGEGLFRLRPPDEYKDVHHKLMDALNDAEAEVALVIDSAKEGDETAIRDLQPRVEKSFIALAAAGKAFDAKVPDDV